MRKLTPVSYRTLALLGCCPALTLFFQLFPPSRVSGIAEHVQSLDDLFDLFLTCLLKKFYVLMISLTKMQITATLAHFWPVFALLLPR